MGRWRWWRRAALLLGVCLAGVPAARGQSTGSAAAAPTSGFGMLAVPSAGGSNGSFGVMAVPMTMGSTTASGTAADPMGMGLMYGPVMPMTPGQAGLFMLSAQQRMLGVGNGQLSGVRPGPGADPKAARVSRGLSGGHPAETHTRNSNVPGGQAARFFNRGGMVAARPRPFYNRQLRQFPQYSQ